MITAADKIASNTINVIAISAVAAFSTKNSTSIVTSADGIVNVLPFSSSLVNVITLPLTSVTLIVPNV